MSFNISVLKGDTFSLTQRVVLPPDSSGGIDLPMSYNFQITGTNPSCVEFLSMTPLEPGTFQEVTTTFTAVQTGSCQINFYVYISHFPITSGTLLGSYDIKIMNSLEVHKNFLPSILLLVILVVLALAIIWFIVKGK